MDLWDQEKLESVVKSKDDEKNRNNPTDIVCKYFLEALEMQKYGWFWVCPSGDACKYRHALPPGFILKKKETDVEKREREEREKENAITIEDFLETERHKLGSKLTPITYESFSKWKAERKAKATIELELEAKKKADAYKVPGKTGLSFSGRELFAFNPDWAKDGDDDAMEFYERQASDDEAEDVPVIDEDLFDEDLDGLEEEEEQEVEMQVSGIEISE